ncbi:unnamed protein product [Sympodiomycopsis kandeliae]
MPASSLSKLALHLSRLANWQAQQAAHQTGNAFKSGLGGSSASSSLSGVGAGPGAGSGGAKFHAGRGAHYSYTNSGGRAVVQAGSSGTSDGSTHFEDDEEHHSALQLSPARSRVARRESTSQSARHSSLAQLEREAAAKGIEFLPGTLNKQALQAKFRQAFAAAHPDLPSITSADIDDVDDLPELTSLDTFSKSAEIHRDLLDAKDRKDRIAVLALVQAYRQLPSSQKTTAGFNAALQAQYTVRESGESLRDVRETHKDMLDTGCLPNSSTSAVLVKALCARDQEKTEDVNIPDVAAEAEASSEAWRIATTCTSGLEDIAAYNALIARCAAKGDTERALATYSMIQQSKGIRANAETYLAVLPCFAILPTISQNDPSVLEERVIAAKICLEEALAAMRAPTWINNQDSEILQAYIDATFHLEAPEEAIDLFQKLISNEGSLSSPAAHVTGSLIHGFVEDGDYQTALQWIHRIESLNSTSTNGKPIIAAPDFTELKLVVAQAAQEVQRQDEHAEEDQQNSQPVALVDTSTLELGVSQDGVSEQTTVDSQLSRSSRSMESPASPSLTSPSQTSAQSATSTHVLAQAPSMGIQGVQVIDFDLGERVKSIIRNRKGNGTQDSKNGSINLENAYRLLMTEASHGTFAPPEVFAQLLNSFGREGKLQRVRELRNQAHIAVAGLVGDLAWQAAAWAEVEDNVISALAHGGDLEGAHAVRHAMLANGSTPSANSYAALISSIRDSTDEAMLAEQLYDESRRLGVRPNIYLINTVISRLGRARRADKALQLYDSLPRLGLKPTSITYGASLNCAVRVGDIHRAESIFQAMEADPGFVARPPGYNSMIQFFTYTKPDRVKALEYWKKMQDRGVRPSSHTYKLLLDVHGTVEPVNPGAMNTLFSQLLRDRNVEVAGPHWASLIDCFGNHVKDLKRCQEIFRSITLKTGSKADAVAYEALLQVYARHGETTLIDGLIAEMIKCGVGRTAYIANQAIEGYSNHGGLEGLMKARSIFLAMSQPPAGMASMGNHPLPRHHGAGSSAGSLHLDRRSLPTIAQQYSRRDLEQTLQNTSSHTTDSTTQQMSLEEHLNMLHLAFENVHPEPSTYEMMISVELQKGKSMQNATVIVQRMEERAFPAALVIKARNLLNAAQSHI